ncbi:MAG: hypothetical protein AAF456_03805 [Planctomycetota bacterium]
MKSRILLRVFVAFLSLPFLAVHLSAQELELIEMDRPAVAENEKAIALFDMQWGELMDQLAGIGFSDEMFEGMESPVPGVRDPRKIKRIFGAASLPDDMAALSAFQEGDAPFKMFVRVEFTDAETCDRAEEEFQRGFNKVVVIEGKNYYGIRAGFIDVPGLVYVRRSPTLFEVGTPGYCASESRDFYTSAALEAFKNAPAGPVRFAADLETKEAFVAALVEMFGGDFVREFEGFVDAEGLIGLYDNMKTINGSFGLESELMLSINIVGRDEENAGEVRSQLDGLVQLAQGVTQQDLEGGFPQTLLGMAWNLYSDTISGTAVTQEGGSVGFAIRRPAALDTVIAQFNETRRIAAMEREQRMRAEMLREVAMIATNFEDNNSVYPFEYTGEDILDRIEAVNPPTINQELSWRAKLRWSSEDMLSRVRDADFERVPIEVGLGPDEEPNSRYSDRIPARYMIEIINDRDLREGRLPENRTHARVVWVRPDNPAKSRHDVVDGLKFTGMLIEYPAGKPWLVHDPISVDEAVQLITSLGENERLAVAFYDGTAGLIGNDADPALIRRLFDPADDPDTAFEVWSELFPEESRQREYNDRDRR